MKPSMSLDFDTVESTDDAVEAARQDWYTESEDLESEDGPADDLDIITTASGRSGRRVPNMVVDGLDETEILALAPARTCDRVHWVTPEEFDARDLLVDLPVGCSSRRWSDGQHRIWVPQGDGTHMRERVRELCAEHNVTPVNLRVEPNVPFRDLDVIPVALLQNLILAIVDWLYPRTFAVRRKIVADNELLSDEDVRSMMYLFVSDHLDRYDADRVGRNGTLNLATFMLGKIRTWPQDAARAMHGRSVLDDHLQLNQAMDTSLANDFRRPTEVELADRMNTDVADVRRRRQAVSEFASMRFPESVVTGGAYGPGEGVDVAGDEDVEDEATAFSQDAALTRAILQAVRYPVSGRGRSAPDPMGLVAVYLTFWGEMSRQQAAATLDVLPKSITTATTRVLGQAGSHNDMSDASTLPASPSQEES